MMAQLRDRRTSDLLAEGDPIGVALIAESLGMDQVLFDGVGVFDAVIVLEAQREAEEATGEPARELPPQAAEAAEVALDRARKRQERAIDEQE